jgi:hypothetical protein
MNNQQTANCGTTKTIEFPGSEPVLPSPSGKRVEWIDLAKFIAISLMVMGHLGLPKPAARLIHVFHMPVFFLLSGYCFNEIKHRKIGSFWFPGQKASWSRIFSGPWQCMPFTWRFHSIYRWDHASLRKRF